MKKIVLPILLRRMFALLVLAQTNVSYADVTVDPAASMTNYTSLGEWNTNGNLEGWVPSQTTATVAGGLLSGTTFGTDSQLLKANFSGGPDLDLGFNDFIEIRLQVPTNYTNSIQIYYGTTSYTVANASGAFVPAVTTGFSTNRVLTIPAASIPTDGAFHVYRMDVGLEPSWRATLRDLRIDPLEGAGTSGMTFAIDYIRVGDEPGAMVYQPRYTTECPAAGGTTPSAALIGPGQTVKSMESKHFRFLWNAADEANASWTADMPHGTLRNLEETWQVHAKKLGYREPAYAMGTTNGTAYKLNVTSWHAGYWAGPDDYLGTAYGRLNITPDGLRVDPPTWVIPHELMHCFQFHNNLGYMPGEWYEFHANYGRERWLQQYQALYANSSSIDPTALRSAHLNIGSGRDYYLSWPFFLYIDENPDGLPDLGEGTAVKLWQQTQSGEYPFMTLERLTPTNNIKDIVGGFARRGATYNYKSKAAIQASLARFGPPLDNAATARWQFTDLVQRSDDTNWWRVAFEMAPMEGAYAIHELVPTGSGAGRVVTVNLHGLPDAARGADWRASFIVIADDGTERYSSLWGNGTNSVTLAANENKVYLSVAGAPATFYYGGADESVYPYRSHPSKVRFPYELQVTGATPKQRDNGATTGMVPHPNGGGYKATSAVVSPTAYLGPNARVLDTATVSGNARIEDYAVVSGASAVSGSAVVSGHAWVRGGTVTGNAKVRDWALVEGGTISGNARVIEHANIKGGVMMDIATAKGTSGSLFGTLAGNAIIDGDYGDYFSGRNLTNAIAFGHQPYLGVPDSFTQALPTGLYAAYDFATTHDSRILDQYGVTDGFIVGSPTWVSSDGTRSGVLAFNGSSQYVNLDRSVADLHNFTFTAWVKPAGGAVNQAVLWLGASSTKRLCFTPNDSAGQAKFSIVNGGAEQVLTAPALATGTWTHVAIMLNGNTGTLFINGDPVATGPVTIRPDQVLAPNTADGLQHNYLARAQGAAMPMFQGSLDDVRFYGSMIPASTVATMAGPGTVIGSTGSFLGLGNTRDKAFDGSLTTYYDAANASGDWVGLDLGSAQKIAQVRYCPRASFAVRMVGGVFEASNASDFSSGVVTLFTISSLPTQGVMTTQLITNSGSYRYVRYLGPTGGYCNVAELEFVKSIATPIGLAAIAGQDQVELSWNVTGGAASYNVKRSTTNGGPYSIIASPTLPEYTDTTAVGGTTYYYVVSAVNSAGQSTNSTEVAATPLVPDPPDPPVPVISVNYKKASSVTPALASTNTAGVMPATNWNNVVDLNHAITFVDRGGSNTPLRVALSGGFMDSWNTIGTPDEIIFGDKVVMGNAPQTLTLSNVPYATYDVYIYVSSWGSEVVEFGINGGSTVATLTNTFTPNNTPGIDFVLNDTYVKLEGLNGNVVVNMRATSDELHLAGFQIAQSAGASAPPVAPTNLMATAGDAQVSLSWTASSGATGYNVKQSLVSGGPYTVIATNLMNAYTNTGLANGTRYYYVVSAVNAGGESGDSPQASALPSSIAPVSLSMSLSSGALNLSWPADHTGWRLQTQTNVLAKGLGTNWFDVSNSTMTNSMNIPVDPNSGSVFYRLIYP